MITYYQKRSTISFVSFFFSSRRRHTRLSGDWSSDVCSSDLRQQPTRLLCPWDYPGKNSGVGCHFLLHCMKVKSESEVAQSCLIFRDPMDCSLPGSSVHGIFQARVLEWGAILLNH